MRQIETPFLEIKILDDGAIRARRKDRKPLTEADREQARRIADNPPGITVDDIMRVWPGAKIVSPEPMPERVCEDCSKSSVPRGRRGGKVIRIIEADGRPALMCHYCGRRVEG